MSEHEIEEEDSTHMINTGLIYSLATDSPKSLIDLTKYEEDIDSDVCGSCGALKAGDVCEDCGAM